MGGDVDAAIARLTVGLYYMACESWWSRRVDGESESFESCV